MTRRRAASSFPGNAGHGVLGTALATLVFLAALTVASPAGRAEAFERPGAGARRVPCFFEENCGQADEGVRYVGGFGALNALA